MAFNTNNNRGNNDTRGKEAALNTDFSVRNVKVWDNNNASFTLDLPALGISFYNMRLHFSVKDPSKFIIQAQQIKGKDGEYRNTAFIRFAREMADAIMKEVGRNA